MARLGGFVLSLVLMLVIAPAHADGPPAAYYQWLQNCQKAGGHDAGNTTCMCNDGSTPPPGASFSTWSCPSGSNGNRSRNASGDAFDQQLGQAVGNAILQKNGLPTSALNQSLAGAVLNALSGPSDADQAAQQRAQEEEQQRQQQQLAEQQREEQAREEQAREQAAQQAAAQKAFEAQKNAASAEMKDGLNSDSGMKDVSSTGSGSGSPDWTAAAQLKSTNASGTAAATSQDSAAYGEASKGFDTPGTYSGSLAPIPAALRGGGSSNLPQALLSDPTYKQMQADEQQLEQTSADLKAKAEQLQAQAQATQDLQSTAKINDQLSDLQVQRSKVDSQISVHKSCMRSYTVNWSVSNGSGSAGQAAAPAPTPDPCH